MGRVAACGFIFRHARIMLESFSIGGSNCLISQSNLDRGFFEEVSQNSCFLRSWLSAAVTLVVLCAVFGGFFL